MLNCDIKDCFHPASKVTYGDCISFHLCTKHLRMCQTDPEMMKIGEVWERDMMRLSLACNENEKNGGNEIGALAMLEAVQKSRLELKECAMLLVFGSKVLALPKEQPPTGEKPYPMLVTGTLDENGNFKAHWPCPDPSAYPIGHPVRDQADEGDKE